VIEAGAAWLEATGPARALRESVVLYPAVSLIHVLGIGLLIGGVTVLDLRLMGAWRQVSLAALAGPARTVAAVGIAIALPSGAALLAARATDYAANPFLVAKLAAILLALANLAILHRSLAWQGRVAGPRLVIGGAVSLACWLAAVSAGRLIAYW
jgi:hypothetical protein